MAHFNVAATRYPGQTCAVLYNPNDPDKVLETRVFRGSPETMVGALWYGRVLGAVSGAKALMVDIGGTVPAFLPYKEIPAGVSLTTGQYVLVAIERQARAEKGPRLTAKIRLSSPRLIFSPYRAGVSASRRLSDADATALMAWAKDGLEEGEGWVIRGAAAGCDYAALSVDRLALRDEWLRVSNYKNTVCCVRPAPDPFAEWLVELSEEIGSVTLTGLSLLEAAKKVLDATQISTSLDDAFAEVGGWDGLEDALSPVVSLSGGGSMTIERTRAFWAVDVDTGGVKGAQAAQRCNTAAINALPNELRRRNIGGAVVVDIIPEGRNKSAVPSARRVLPLLQKLVAGDSQVQVYGVSPMGHLELVRSRRGLSIEESVQGDTLGAGKASVETEALCLLRDAVKDVRAGNLSALTLRMSVSVFGWLNGAGRYAVAEAEAMLGQSLQKEIVK